MTRAPGRRKRLLADNLQRSASPGKRTWPPRPFLGGFLAGRLAGAPRPGPGPLPGGLALAWRWVILPAASLPAAQASGRTCSATWSGGCPWPGSGGSPAAGPRRRDMARPPGGGPGRPPGAPAPDGGPGAGRRPPSPHHPGGDLLPGDSPGGVAAPPPPASLRGLDLADPGAWLGAVTAAEYLGLALMAAGTLGLAWRGALPAAWRGEPAWRLAGLAGGVALCLLLRAGAGLDLAPPAWPARGWPSGRGGGLAALLSGLLRFWSPASPNGADESAWPAALTGLVALAVIARDSSCPRWSTSPTRRPSGTWPSTWPGRHPLPGRRPHQPGRLQPSPLPLSAGARRPGRLPALGRGLDRPGRRRRGRLGRAPGPPAPRPWPGWPPACFWPWPPGRWRWP